jgi:hypothetical protein
MRRFRDGAAGMAEDAVTGLEPRLRRRPASRQTGIEQLLRRRFVIPHGDRRDRADSRGVENEHETLTPRHDDVVSVFVLRNDLANGAGRLLDAHPIEHGAECAEIAQSDTKARQVAVGNVTDRVDDDVAHGHRSA